MPVHTSHNYPEIAILPQPLSITHANGFFSLTQDTTIITDQRTQTIGKLLAELLAPALGFMPRVLTSASPDLPIISLAIDPELTDLGNEAYTLTVTPQQARLRAAHPAGIFYAAQTLRQLLPTDIFSSTQISRNWLIPAVTIRDSPRFQWRGCMLDTARHFIPKQELCKFIDLLALHKMNVLHLHLTDDQGWRIEIKKYPRLTAVGSQRKETVVGHARISREYDGKPHGGFYTQDDLRQLVAYADARFITLVPEIDLPGHAQAAIAAYPELGVLSAPPLLSPSSSFSPGLPANNAHQFGEPVEVATTWGIHPYLYNTRESTFHFLKDVLSEVMDIFPSLYIHVGGDEAIKNQWQASPEIQAHIKELGLHDEHELQGWFLSQIGAFLTQHGRLMLGWDEILEGGLPAGATVMSWRGIAGGIAAAQAGHDVVMTPQTHVYLDHYQSNDPTEQLAIGGYSPLEKVYTFDPIPEILTPEQAQHVLGAQCNLWTEYVSTPEYLEYMTFPRAIALSELTWTPKKQLDFADFRARLAVHEARLTSLDVTFRPVAKLDLEQTFPKRPSIW